MVAVRIHLIVVATHHLAGRLALMMVLAGTCHAASDAVPSAPSETLDATIVDAETGQPTPCTVTIIDSSGRTVTEGESFRGGFRCDGRFTKRLPAGPARLRVTRGFETRDVERVVEVQASGETKIRLALERVVDLRRRGWFSGDSHAHMIHGEQTIKSDFDQVARAVQAEDLQYLSLAQAWALSEPTPEKLAAELGRRSTARCLLTWNLEAPKNYYRGDAGRCLGHCWTLGMRGRTKAGADVITGLLQASAHDYESDKPCFANFESHRLIHDQGGAAFYSHPARWWTGPWGGQGGYPRQEKMRISNLAVELPLDALIGPSFDGLDVMTGNGEFQANAMAFDLWCLLLNRGYRLAATGSSDSCFDRPGGATPGAARTYTFLRGGFSLRAITRATAQGRTFVTTGPLLLASVEGQPPGSAFAANGRPRRLRLEAWASGTDPKGLTRLEILRNGKPFQTNLFVPPVSSLETNLDLPGTVDAWYCARVFGGDPQRERAVSGAFFFDSKPFRPPSPVPARVRVLLVDAETGAKLSGSVTEVAQLGIWPQVGQEHRINQGEGALILPATVRLRAEAAGHEPATLSPFLDSPPLVEYITRLEAEDLVKWETFEKTRALLGAVTLRFELQKKSR
jgi:hypothetical protein